MFAEKWLRRIQTLIGEKNKVMAMGGTIIPGRSRRDAWFRRNKAASKVYAREVLDVLQRQQGRYGTQRKLERQPNRGGRKSYRLELRRSTGFLATRTSLSTLPTPRGALCWTWSPDAGSGEATGLLDFTLSVIFHQASASRQYQLATGGAPNDRWSIR